MFALLIYNGQFMDMNSPLQRRVFEETIRYSWPAGGGSVFRQPLPGGMGRFAPRRDLLLPPDKRALPLAAGADGTAPHFLFRKDLARRPVSEANRRFGGGSWAGDKRAAAGPKENFWPVKIDLTIQPSFQRLSP